MGVARPFHWSRNKFDGVVQYGKKFDCVQSGLRNAVTETFILIVNVWVQVSLFFSLAVFGLISKIQRVFANSFHHHLSSLRHGTHKSPWIYLHLWNKIMIVRLIWEVDTTEFRYVHRGSCFAIVFSPNLSFLELKMVNTEIRLAAGMDKLKRTCSKL